VPTSSNRRRPPAWLTLLAAAGPLGFAVLLALIDASQSGWLHDAGQGVLSHSPMSVNSYGPHGALMIAAFLFFGVALIALAAVTRAGLEPGRARTWAVVSIGLLAAGMLLAGPKCDCELYGKQMASTWHGDLHFAGFSLMLTSQPLIALSLWRSLRGDAAWRGYSRAFAAAAAVGIPLYIVLAFAQLPFSWWYAWFVVFITVPLQAFALRLRRDVEAERVGGWVRAVEAS
jgi:Protein of unknown function (DUF998)